LPVPASAAQPVGTRSNVSLVRGDGRDAAEAVVGAVANELAGGVAVADLDPLAGTMPSVVKSSTVEVRRCRRR
jgi:hypothetical protein